MQSIFDEWLVLFGGFLLNFMRFLYKKRTKIVKNTKNKNAQKVNKYAIKRALKVNTVSTFT